MYDQQLANRVRDSVGQAPGIVEKQMFGGLAFLLDGNMSVCVYGDELIVRVPPDEAEAALSEPGVRRFDMSGRPMKGWLLVGGTAITESAALRKWVQRGVKHTASLPKKGHARLKVGAVNRGERA